MRFAQEKHTDAGLSDPAADRIWQLFVQNGFLERQICPLRTAGFYQLLG